MQSVAEVKRDQWAGTVFTTWVVLGLFLDGWAHNAGKPEDFWTPWHAVLYSGFVVGAGWFAFERWRRRREGLQEHVDPLLRDGVERGADGSPSRPVVAGTDGTGARPAVGAGTSTRGAMRSQVVGVHGGGDSDPVP